MDTLVVHIGSPGNMREVTYASVPGGVFHEVSEAPYGAQIVLPTPLFTGQSVPLHPGPEIHVREPIVCDRTLLEEEGLSLFSAGRPVTQIVPPGG